jgi:hypothetical protein
VGVYVLELFTSVMNFEVQIPFGGLQREMERCRRWSRNNWAIFPMVELL